MLRSGVLPVEFARRPRVFSLGEELGDDVLIDTGDEQRCVKLVLRGILSVPVRSILGKERRFSSTVDAGEADRGDSMNGMETVRWFGGRKVVDVFNEGVGG